MSSAPSVSVRRVSALELAAVFVGGLIGTSLRLLIDLALAHDLDEFALSTLLVNTLGAFALGVLVAALWPRVPGWVRAGLGPGILGSFTTFSALAVSVVALTQAGDLVGAVLTVVLSIGLGMLAAWSGLTLGARLGGLGSRGSAASPAGGAGDGDRETPESKDVDR
ncbi:fluoride efflux transporter FluC [Microcella frigidaquae]|jgi:CrcB protein|uniref:Fluoride-specific ion channel FluC n=1 Tax=Microcella frigidaquae TaxID=424758 RepID=A0A840X6K6_9MICO|nr:CrcB family protein [Microcella frigidaquae]MBB5618173.1 CrcB protein [Microcella frigidaquae]NHN44491.1 CrcB family protein [Microcella frigidaquae]